MTDSGPKWLGIGAQRCGTTWFTRLLTHHPQMDVPGGQFEHHVLYRFGLLREWGEKPQRRYQKLFEGDEVKLGEFTPFYIRSPWTPAVTKAILPEDTPLIVLLRDPVDRYASSLRHAMGNALKRYRRNQKKARANEGQVESRGLVSRISGKLSKSVKNEQEFARIASATDESLVYGRPTDKPEVDVTWLRYVSSAAAWGGMYASQLDAWTSVFPKDRFIVIQYEKLRRDPQHYADLVWKRVGLDPVPIVEPERKGGPRKVERWDPKDHPQVVRGLQDIYRADAERLAAEWDIDLSLWRHTMEPVSGASWSS